MVMSTTFLRGGNPTLRDDGFRRILSDRTFPCKTVRVSSFVLQNKNACDLRAHGKPLFVRFVSCDFTPRTRLIRCSSHLFHEPNLSQVLLNCGCNLSHSLRLCHFAMRASDLRRVNTTPDIRLPYIWRHVSVLPCKK
jgi:hypothetical protein